MSNLLSLINDTSHLVWQNSLELHFQAATQMKICLSHNWIWACADDHYEIMWQKNAENFPVILEN